MAKDIVMRWNTEIRRATKLPDMKERLVNEGVDIASGPPELFQTAVRQDVEKWTRLVKNANIKAVP